MAQFEIIFRIIKKITGERTQAEVAKAIGITPGAISDAKRRGVIPETWIKRIIEKYGKTHEELCQQLLEGIEQAEAELIMGKHNKEAAKNLVSAEDLQLVHGNFLKKFTDQENTGDDEELNKFYEAASHKFRHVFQFAAETYGTDALSLDVFFEEFMNTFKRAFPDYRYWRNKKREEIESKRNLTRDDRTDKED